MNNFEFIETIEKYNSIVIFRHTRPDLDALGSQLGLKELIKLNYPTKNVYVVGDKSKRYEFIGNMDEISDTIISNSLAIICDVAVSHLVSDERYRLAKEVIVVDHHKNECTVDNAKTLVDTSRVATAELLSHIFMRTNKKVNAKAATALFGGIVTDSGRFQYSNTTSDTFIIASWLVANGADTEFIYNNLYVETLAQRNMKNYFSNRFKTTKYGVAYMFNDQKVLDKFNVPFFDISRGMVNVMAGIDEIKIWCNFTYDKENDKVVGEFRSRGIEIVEIAKKYGGGGHAVACGATLDNFDVCKQVIKDFNNLLKNKE